jgi:hypothetical protein
MAKKKEKAKGKKASGNPADALRDAVERTFAGAAGGAAGAQKRAQDLFDDATSALNRLREGLEQGRLLEQVEQLREQVDGLAGRVAALEAAAKPATTTKRSTSSRSASGTTRSRSTTRRSTGGGTKPASGTSSSGSTGSDGSPTSES